MEMNSVLKLVTLVAVFNSINARSLDFEEARVEEARRMGVLPITQECRDTIQDVFFEGKDSVKLSDWSRIYLEQSYKASRAIRLPKWAPDAAEDSFHEIDLNKNELIELEEFQKEYLDKIEGYFFTAGNNNVSRSLVVSAGYMFDKGDNIEEHPLFISDGWSSEKINKNTCNCEFFNPLMTQHFLGYVKIAEGERPDASALLASPGHKARMQESNPIYDYWVG